ncbi:hypothetical protein Y032_0016g3097 [Ancylostoma ceylanicum]|uniref:Uncharacterized protein n=1 Tax=Ancylostoma ceylanicum TaxID=53326 RepID=A0A016V5Z0_9BILA|nr:hypothetical protein Y032_0016g3097 [Ancylostoma ceylanicum]
MRYSFLVSRTYRYFEEGMEKPREKPPLSPIVSVRVVVFFFPSSSFCFRKVHILLYVIAVSSDTPTHTACLCFHSLRLRKNRTITEMLPLALLRFHSSFIVVLKPFRIIVDT